MSDAVASERMLGPRSGAVALLLTYFLSVAGFAYVRHLRLGVIFAVLPFLVMVTLGRFGVASTLPGFYVLMGLLAIVLIGGLVIAFRLARTTPVPTPARWYNRWYHYLWIGLCVVLFMNFVVRHRGPLFGYDQFRIPSSSMQPTLAPGDFITVDARGSTLTKIERGDIVIYVPRRHPDQTWTARVVGLPGETIVAKDHRVEIEGRRLAEAYLGMTHPADLIPVPFERTTLGSDEFFLMGDNRPNAEDSRFQGPIARSALRGKVRAIWFSLPPTTFSIETARIGTLPAAHAP